MFDGKEGPIHTLVELAPHVPVFLAHFEDGPDGNRSFLIVGVEQLLECRDAFQTISDVRCIQVLVPASNDSNGDWDIRYLEELWMTGDKKESVLLKLTSGACVELTASRRSGRRTFFCQLKVSFEPGLIPAVG